MAEIDRLTTVFDANFARLDAKLDKHLSRSTRAIYGASSKIQKRLDTIKFDPGQAFKSVFDSSRLKVLDSGAARIGLFGSALQHLGPAGLVAAGGVAAVVAAFVGAKDAARFADEIADTAKRLHVTTDALQEYRYAIRAAGGEEKGADEALENFSVTLGKAQQGLAKSQRAFLALGFTREQIKGFTSAEEALTAVVERISGLSDVQQDAIIAQLGLEGIKPLIDDGAEAMTRLRAEAHKVGVVMDADLIKRGAEIHEQFETVSKVIDVQMKSALVDLGPVLIDLLGLMAQMAVHAANIADRFRQIENRRTASLLRMRERLIKDINDPLHVQGGPLGFVATGAWKQLQQIDAELADRARESAAPAPPTTNLIDTSRTAGGGSSAPRDTTDQRTEQVAGVLAGSQRDLLAAQQRLTENINERADAERAMIDAELAQEIARLEKQKADIADDEGLSAADKAILTARLDEAATLQRQAAEARKALVKREEAWAVEDAADETRRQVFEAEIANLQRLADQATTARERRALELEILRLKQIEAYHEGAKERSRLVETGAITEDEALRRAEAQRSTFGGEQQDALARTRGPLEEFLAKSKEVNDSLQTMAVDGLQSLNAGIVDAIMNAKDLGDVARNVFRQIVADLLNMAVSKASAAVVSQVIKVLPIPGFAEGTSSAPGGLAWVGERGKELVNLPKGSKVMPHAASIRAMAGAQAVPRGGGVTIIQPFHLHAEGAVMTGQLMADLDRRSRAHAARGAAAAVSASRRGFASTMTQQQLLGTT